MCGASRLPGASQLKVSRGLLKIRMAPQSYLVFRNDRPLLVAGRALDSFKTIFFCFFCPRK